MKSKLREKIENCAYCDGTGKVKLDGTVYDCIKCFDDRQKLEKFQKANIPQNFFDFHPEDIKDGMTVKIDLLNGKSKEFSYKDFYNEYLNQIKKFYEIGNGLYLYGPNASGKSTLAYLIGKNILKTTSYSVKCYNHLSLLKDFQRTWGRDNQAVAKTKFIQAFKETDFLIIDDFLFQEHNSDWAREFTSEMLRLRVDNNLPTIFTSNYNIDEIAKIIDKNKETQNSISIISKLLETIDCVVEFENQNFRLENVGKNSVLFSE